MQPVRYTSRYPFCPQNLIADGSLQKTVHSFTLPLHLGTSPDMEIWLPILMCSPSNHIDRRSHMRRDILVSGRMVLIGMHGIPRVVNRNDDASC
jgi:hypothetical protein